MSTLLPFTHMPNNDFFAQCGIACRTGCTGTSGQDGKNEASETDTPQVSNIQLRHVVLRDVLVLTAHINGCMSTLPGCFSRTATTSDDLSQHLYRELRRRGTAVRATLHHARASLEVQVLCKHLQAA